MARRMTGTDPVETIADGRTKADPFKAIISKLADRLGQDADCFVLPAQDLNGHSESVHTRIQPGWVRSLSSIVASRQFPFRTQGDVIRFCIYVGMRVLLELDPSQSIEKSTDLMLAIVRQRDRIIEMENLFEQAVSRVVVLRRRGFDREVRQLLTELRVAINSMPGGEIRELYQKRFDALFSSWTIDITPLPARLVRLCDIQTKHV